MTTLNLQVGAGTDDAQEAESNTNYTDTATIVAHQSHASDSTQRRWAGHRFTNVTIPQGSTINSANLSLNIWLSGFDNIDGDWYCHKVANSATFSATASPFDRSGAKTTAKTTQSATSIGTGWIVMADLADEVQEVINQGSWSSGNALSVLFDPTAATTRVCYSISYDNDTTLAGKIAIDYTEPISAYPVDMQSIGTGTVYGSTHLAGNTLHRIGDQIVGNSSGE